MGLIVSPYLIDITHVPLIQNLNLDQKHTPVVVWDVYRNCVLLLKNSEAAALRKWTSKDVVHHPGQVKILRKLGALVESNSAFRRHRFIWAEIEICSHCNFRCCYCPVRHMPKPKQFIDERLFLRILDALSEYGISTVSFHHYNEPTLDRNFIYKVRETMSRNLSLKLFSNGSRLTQNMLSNIAAWKQNIELVINLPSTDPEVFASLTGTNPQIFHQVLNHIECASDMGFNTTVSVNAFRGEEAEQQTRIASYLQHLGVEVPPPDTSTRAGYLKNSNYGVHTNHCGPLNGCWSQFFVLPVSITGDVFLCCMDYEQNYCVGNLDIDPLDKIAGSHQAIRLRRQVWGGEYPPPTLLCNRCERTAPYSALTIGNIKNTSAISAFVTQILPALLTARGTGERIVYPTNRQDPSIQ